MDGNQVPDFLKPVTPQEALKKFTLNLTDSARQNKIDPVVGREVEIRRIMEILSRRTKNNPVLIGDPGVGKTAIVEGLAQKIIENAVPTPLKDKEVIVLDFALLLAGAKFRGEFEERLKGVIKAVEEADSKYIMFIDELHTLVGGGAAEGSSDAANILKPALARGSLRMIGNILKKIQHSPAVSNKFLLMSQLLKIRFQFSEELRRNMNYIMAFGLPIMLLLQLQNYLLSISPNGSFLIKQLI
jgi:ATP-dependent Clp protease ATP-binding subunit ClpA